MVTATVDNAPDADILKPTENLGTPDKNESKNGELIAFGPKKTEDNFIYELDALTYPHLNQIEYELGELPQYKLTNFSIVNNQDYFVSLDCGLLEKGEEIFAYGEIKSLWDSEPDENACPMPTVKLSEITEWLLSGFDGGEEILISIGTQYAFYYLEMPCKEYAEQFEPFLIKSVLLKHVIETVGDSYHITFTEMVDEVLMKASKHLESKVVFYFFEKNFFKAI